MIYYNQINIIMKYITLFWEIFSKVNKIYSQYFSHKPARSTIEVAKLPLWALVEIEVVAVKN